MGHRCSRWVVLIVMSCRCVRWVLVTVVGKSWRLWGRQEGVGRGSLVPSWGWRGFVGSSRTGAGSLEASCGFVGAVETVEVLGGARSVVDGVGRRLERSGDDCVDAMVVAGCLAAVVVRRRTWGRAAVVEVVVEVVVGVIGDRGVWTTVVDS